MMKFLNFWIWRGLLQKLGYTCRCSPIYRTRTCGMQCDMVRTHKIGFIFFKHDHQHLKKLWIERPGTDDDILSKRRRRLTCATGPLEKSGISLREEYLSQICVTSVHKSVVSWGVMLQARVPMKQLNSFDLPNTSSRIMTLMLTKPLTKMSTRSRKMLLRSKALPTS
jgi:hypothetical protein